MPIWSLPKVMSSLTPITVGIFKDENSSSATDSGLYVYRTENAIKRSSRSTPPASRRPRGAEWGISSRGINMAEHAGPLPRGHLAFYRQIIPPTTCRAFRARIDRAGTPEERAVLGTAGIEAVYLYDLDDPSLVETIPLESSERIRLQVGRLTRHR